eukprot:gene3765-4713_t
MDEPLLEKEKKGLPAESSEQTTVVDVLDVAQEEAEEVSTSTNPQDEMYCGVPKAELFDTGIDGLNTEEAMSRLAKFGRNEVVSKKTHPLLKLLYRFAEPMAVMIWVAIIIEGVNQDWVNMIVLGVLQVLNAVVGWWEEFKAGNAVDALRAALKPEAIVKRDGAISSISAAELVPGDRVMLLAVSCK